MDPTDDEAGILSKLETTRANLVALLDASSSLNKNLNLASTRLSVGLESIAAATDVVAPLQTQSIVAKALLKLQDEYEGILQQIKHKGIGEVDGGGKDGEDVEMDGLEQKQLGSDLEVEVLGRISETLASNDCLDICIDIYVKVRYRRAAKALMRLNPRYLKTFAPEEIDKMEWEVLESAITLWIQHFQLAVNAVFVAEKKLCKQVLSGVMDGAIWPECFTKIADKIMAVFFRFGEGVARSSKEPQKLFKLLDMYDAMDKMRTEFFQVFDGDSGVGICSRFRELQKLLVHAASKVFWEFGLQIEGLEDGAPPPPDGSVPKVVRYAVNYLKCLAGSGYAATMGQVLRTEQMWKAGFLSRPEPDESILQEAISSALDALQRNVEAKRSRYRDKVIPHVLAMNTYWYMYMRTRGSELAKLVGEETMKKKYKTRAEEAAYYYQAQAWGPLVKLLEREEESIGEGVAVARGKMEIFMREFDENMRRHQANYTIPDADLREQIKEAVEKLVVPAYAGFLHSYSGVMQGRSFLPPDSIQGLLGRLFGGGDIKPGRKIVVEGDGGITNVKRRVFRNRREEEEKVEEEEVRVERRGSFGRKDERGSFGRREERGSFRRKDEQESFGRKEENERGEERFERKGGGSFGRKEERNGAQIDFENKEEEKPLETFGMLIGKRSGSFGRKEGRREGRGSIGRMEELGGGGGFGRRGGKEARTQNFGKTQLGSFGRSGERREEEEDNIDTRENNDERARSAGRREFRNQRKGAIKTTVEVEKPYSRRREEQHNNIETREEKKERARSVGRREISNNREGEIKTTLAAEKPYFMRRREEEQNNIAMREGKEERARRRERREFRNQEEGEMKLTMEAEKPYFRRREFHKQEEMRKNDEEENREGTEWNKGMVERGITNFGRRRFKNQLEGGSGPLVNHLVT